MIDPDDDCRGPIDWPALVLGLATLAVLYLVR